MYDLISNWKWLELYQTNLGKLNLDLLYGKLHLQIILIVIKSTTTSTNNYQLNRSKLQSLIHIKHANKTTHISI